MFGFSFIYSSFDFMFFIIIRLVFGFFKDISKEVYRFEWGLFYL